MNDSGQLLFFLAMIALLSLMDAISRRARRRRIEEMEREQSEGGGHEFGTEDAPTRFEWETEEPDIQREPEPLAPPDEVWVPIGIDEQLEAESERRTREEAVRRPAAEQAPAPPLVAAAEELRARVRSELERTPDSPVLGPPEGGPLQSMARPRSAAAVHARRLRSLFRGDATALRSAVLYREILGGPLGWRRGPGGWEDPGQGFLRDLETSEDMRARRRSGRR